VIFSAADSQYPDLPIVALPLHLHRIKIYALH